VAVKIKLKRLGKIREPYYRIVVADARTKRDGRAIEEIGKYQPKNDPSIIDVDSERVQYWLSVGAQPTESVQKLLQVTGDWQKFKGLPGAEGTLKVAEPKADKKERYEELAKASLTAKEDAKAASRSARGPKKETAKDSAKDSAKKEAPAAEATDEAAVAAVASGEPAKAEVPADGGSEA
jgi:small subunit ribosomal protein S16